MSADAPAAVWIVLTVVAAIILVALIDLVRHDVRHLPKWAWAIIVVVSFPLGVILYVALGRVAERPVDSPATQAAGEAASPTIAVTSREPQPPDEAGDAVISTTGLTK